MQQVEGRIGVDCCLTQINALVLAKIFYAPVESYTGKTRKKSDKKERCWRQAAAGQAVIQK